MSKSLGNVIDPVDYIEAYGVDAIRYYLLRYIPSNNDGDFSLDRFEEVYQSDLANNLGNLVSRVSAMLVKYNDGVYQPSEVINSLGLEGLMAGFRFDRCLELIFAKLDSLNVAIDTNKPWQLVKTNEIKATEFLSKMASELVAVADILEPYLPESARKIKKTFNAGSVDSSVGILFPRID